MTNSRHGEQFTYLFNITADPNETTDLVDLLPEQVDILKAKMEEALADSVPEYDRDFPRKHHSTTLKMTDHPSGRLGTNSVDWCFP